MMDGSAYSALIPPDMTLNSSIASVEGAMEVAPNSYSVMSNPSRNQPPESRLLPLMRRPTRVARIPVPPEVMSDPPGVNTTPGVSCASCQNARPFKGMFTMDLFSITCPTEDESVTSNGASAWTVIVSFVEPSAMPTSNRASCATCRTIPRKDLDGNPGASTRRVYSPIGNSEMEYSPPALLRAVRCCAVAMLVAVIVASGIAAPLGSVTVPSSLAVDC